MAGAGVAGVVPVQVAQSQAALVPPGGEGSCRKARGVSYPVAYATRLDAALYPRILTADARYGNFASAHEALGVASEEWDELRDAIRANNLEAIRHEALDMAAVLVRLWAQLGEDEAREIDPCKLWDAAA